MTLELLMFICRSLGSTVTGDERDLILGDRMLWSWRKQRVTLVMKISVDNEMGPSWGKGHAVLYCDGIEPFLGLLWDTS